MPMPKAAEELKPAVAFLERELGSWPQVTAKSMFGMVTFYRGKKIFAALPHTRALGATNAIMCKLPADQQAGDKKRSPGKGWKTIEIASIGDVPDGVGIREALGWLERAYQQARAKK
jgi:hypothetical protein